MSLLSCGCGHLMEGQLGVSKAPILSLEPRATGRPSSLWKRLLEARCPRLPLIRFPQDSGRLDSDMGSLAGAVSRLRGHFLQEGYAATRWQWHHSKHQMQGSAPEKGAEVQRLKEHFSMTPLACGQQCHQLRTFQASEDTASAASSANSSRLYMGYCILSPSNPYGQVQRLRFRKAENLPNVDGWGGTELGGGAAEPPRIFPPLCISS